MTGPMHVQLAEVLRARIEAGEFAGGRKLPSEAALMEAHALSRTTVRAALKELQNQGLLRSASGRGYFVREFEHFAYRPQDDFRRDSTITDADSFTQAAAKRNPTQQINVQIAKATEDVARRMRIAPGTPVVIRRRLRFLDGVPFQINDSHYSLDLVNGTEIMSPASVDRGVNQVLAEIGHAQVRALDEIWVRMPTPEEARQLQLGPGTPVAEHIITGFTADNRVVRVVRVIIPGDRNVITFERTHPDYESGSASE
jgi:DNA-binding GntR family transcriptional regulator